MAESFVFEIAGQILGKLTTLAFREIGLIWGVKSEFKRLEDTVSAIKSVHLDAAEQRKKSRHVEDWLDKLQDVLYDVDDVLDDFSTEDLRRKVVIKGSKRKEVSNFFSSSNSLALRVTMSRKLKKIRSRLEDIDADKQKFNFVVRFPDIPVAYPVRVQTHSYVHAPDVIGRDIDKKKIVELLLSSSSSGSSTQNISVLPIVGLGGLGKTTLAKLVYNDDEIVSNFDTRLWICVSEDFDLKKLIVKIMKDATGDDHAHLELNQLQARLRQNLDSKKFFLVLDDVWNDDRQTWIDLKNLLNCGSHESKIVVTTRKKTTAEIMGTFRRPYELKGLSEDECMSLFVKCAFEEGQEKPNPKLVEIGKAIVRKCGGLPLAVRSLGCLLRTKNETREEWVRIRDDDIWKNKEEDIAILPVLKLSYDEMPPCLKQCFAYCAKFPKDVEISSSDLIAEWMSNGLIHSSDGSCQLEDTGSRYLHELISRSFFQDVNALTFDGMFLRFKMHDMMHDLALVVSKKEISHVEFDGPLTVSETTRHLLLCDQNPGETEFPCVLLKLKKVRSFSFMFQVGPMSKTFLDTLIKTFQCLRNLDLEGSEFEELPSSIGKLKYLRYLNICKNVKIKALPDAICNLVNLQTVNLFHCMMLQNLPRDFGNLWSLRFLQVTSKMACFPSKGLAEGLSSLQFLWIISCDNLESLSKEMENLIHLRHLIIAECPSLTSFPAESMMNLTSLQKLVIGNCEKLNLLEEDHMMMALPRSLLSLEIWGMPTLKELPRGFANAASTIEYISIANCSCFEMLPEWLNKCTSLLGLELVNCKLLKSPPLGVMDQLTALRLLRIKNCSEELRRKCERETGEYWPWISQIPKIYLDRSDYFSLTYPELTQLFERYPYHVYPYPYIYPDYSGFAFGQQ